MMDALRRGAVGASSAAGLARPHAAIWRLPVRAPRRTLPSMDELKSAGCGCVDQTKSEWFRGRANECVALAAEATIPFVRCLHEWEAERWFRLAELTR